LSKNTFDLDPLGLCMKNSLIKSKRIEELENQIKFTNELLEKFSIEMLEPLDGTTMYRLNKWLKSLRLALTTKETEK
jgi:hypothetical protein